MKKRLIRRTRAGHKLQEQGGEWATDPKDFLHMIAPLVISAYKEQRSIREIMKAFKIPSTTTVYKIPFENSIDSQVYIKKAKTR